MKLVDGETIAELRAEDLPTRDLERVINRRKQLAVQRHLRIAEQYIENVALRSVSEERRAINLNFYEGHFKRFACSRFLNTVVKTKRIVHFIPLKDIQSTI